MSMTTPPTKKTKPDTDKLAAAIGEFKTFMDNHYRRTQEDRQKDVLAAKKTVKRTVIGVLLTSIIVSAMQFHGIKERGRHHQIEALQKKVQDTFKFKDELNVAIDAVRIVIYRTQYICKDATYDGNPTTYRAEVQSRLYDLIRVVDRHLDFLDTNSEITKNIKSLIGFTADNPILCPTSATKMSDDNLHERQRTINTMIVDAIKKDEATIDTLRKGNLLF